LESIDTANDIETLNQRYGGNGEASAGNQSSLISIIILIVALALFISILVLGWLYYKHRKNKFTVEVKSGHFEVQEDMA